MKTCTKCKETKPLSEFHNDKRNPDGYHSWCKDCIREKQRLYGRAKYRENRARVIKMFDDKCLDCDEQFPPNLYDIHHLEPSSKKYNIGFLMGKKWSTRMDIELAKCIMLCPTCHRARHPRGWNVAG